MRLDSGDWSELEVETSSGTWIFIWGLVAAGLLQALPLPRPLPDGLAHGFSGSDFSVSVELMKGDR